jgi:hypothetical protein
LEKSERKITMTYRKIVPAGGYRQTPTNWKEWGGEIINAQRELQEHYSEMDEYTRNHIKAQIDDLKAVHMGTILGGMLAEMNGAIDGYQAAQSKLLAARQMEARSWDAGKLAAELNVSTALVNMAVKTHNDPMRGGPTAAQRLQAIWEDAQLSGDKHKIRALAEVLQSTRDSIDDHDTRITAGVITTQAAAKVNELRQTSEIRAAVTGINEAQSWLAQVYQAERQSMIDLGEGDPAGMFSMGSMAQAMKRIKQDRQTGEITILAKDDPDVIGYTLPKMNGNEAQNE